MFKNKLVAVIFFMLNTLWLPLPLLYTNLLSIIYFKRLLRTKYFILLISFLLLLGIYSIIHFYYGVDAPEYLMSTLLYILIFVNVLLVHWYLTSKKENLHEIFLFIIKLNFILFTIGLIVVVFGFETDLWRFYKYSKGVQASGIPRFQGFFYEPSYYALLFSPLLVYFFLLFINNRTYKSFYHFIFVMFPVIATVSFGVLLSLGISLGMVGGYVFFKYQRVNKMVVTILLLLPILIIVGLMMQPEILVRILRLLEGTDGSANGRIVNSFIIADYLAEQKNIFFGIGSGQIKTFGAEYIRNFYGYQKSYRVSIPNSFCETLAIFGYIGVFIRLFIELIMFYYFKVYKNVFNLILFLFIFIYQFTGSYITSTLEYVVWLFAFIPLFTRFNLNHAKKNIK